MICIVTAIFSEAKGLIEYFGLKQIDKKPFLIYANDNISLIVSGMGKLNSAIATTYIAKDKQIKKIVNIGICGTNNIMKEKGSLCDIKAVIDATTGKKISIAKKGEILYTFDNIVYKKESLKKNILIDMEGYGFYKAAKIFTNKENIKIYKIISDYLSTEHITNNFIYNLIKQNISEIDI